MRTRVNDSAPTLSVQPGQVVQVHADGRLLAAAVRHGRGWSVMVDDQQHEATSLDAVLSLLDLLPDHHYR